MFFIRNHLSETMTPENQILEIDDNWSLRLIDSNEYDPENNRRYEWSLFA